MINTSNILFVRMQLISSFFKDVKEAPSDLEMNYAILYLFLAICCYITIGYTYYRPKHITSVTWVCTAYIIVRLIFRIFDFEDSRDQYENVDDWNFGMMCQTYAIMMGLIYLVNFFESSWFRNSIAYLLVLLTGFSVILIFKSSQKNQYLVIFKEDYPTMLMIVFGYTWILRVLQNLNS